MGFYDKTVYYEDGVLNLADLDGHVIDYVETTDVDIALEILRTWKGDGTMKAEDRHLFSPTDGMAAIVEIKAPRRCSRDSL